MHYLLTAAMVMFSARAVHQLECYTCVYESGGSGNDTCANGDNSDWQTQLCDANSVCAIRFSNDEDIDTMFARGCLVNCQEGCVSSNDNEICYSCCDSDLCNGISNTSASVLLVITQLFLVVLNNNK
ncbi:uncharacterized protein LOC144349969 [Saccoglossus kowalevskii]